MSSSDNFVETKDAYVIADIVLCVHRKFQTVCLDKVRSISCLNVLQKTLNVI